MSPEPTYWKSLEELRADSVALARRRTEFVEDPRAMSPEERAASTSRRDFLAQMGFSLSAAALSACSRAPVQKAIPFLNKPEEITPGVASWYATTCGGCPASCSLLVKTRDGRPIKVEGNAESTLFGGGTCAVGQATVLSLYDGERLRGPLWRGQPARWSEIDRQVQQGLQAAATAGGAIVLLSGTLVSPSTRELIDRWLARYPRARHVVYDAVSFDALLEAAQQSFGQRRVPHFRFDRARVVVGIEADFLGSWLSPVEFTRQYAEARRPSLGTRMAQHVQFEAGLSLTGANADRRVPVAPSEQRAVVFALLHHVAQRAGVAPPPLPSLSIDGALVTAVADDLWRNRGESLVVSGVQDLSLQIAVNTLNQLLGNVGHTLEIDRPSLQKQGNDRDMASLLDDMDLGNVHVLIVYGANPVYDHPDAARVARAMEKVALRVSFADRLDETATLAHAVCPDHHFLEAWGDAEPVATHYSLAQPTIAPLFETRAAQESLLRWMGADSDHYAYVRDFWRRRLHPRAPSAEEAADFDRFWDHALHDGVRALSAEPVTSAASRFEWPVAAERLARFPPSEPATRARETYELHLYEPVALRDGRHANNPWLQELPDPVTKVTWGNYAAVAPSLATRLGLEDGDVVAIETARSRIELPVVVQPGQSARVVSVALGYGRTTSGKVGRGVGANGFALAEVAADGMRRYGAESVVLAKTGRREPIAATQTHHSMEGRPIVRELDRAALDRAAARSHEDDAELPTLWAEHPAGEHAWGLSIDLTACTGCSACVTACQAENNVPIVGKDEVRRGREMHWIRIDRYYAGTETDPDVVFQPMMCQHCNDAPCEPVCPVLATVHSSDGINQQVYNRCVGTRYCENNCPYKVRRFNWFNYAQSARFDYHMNDPVGTMVLNPDVVVRSRGVMEKCSLCVQRIQEGKLAAKQAGRTLADGDIQTACQQACPAQAIVFGDRRDAQSGLGQRERDARHYRVLADLGTRPNVGYLAKVRNRG
jgi:molybdopterin-containing oxidoreductase family iron-sulfur binding subunit